MLITSFFDPATSTVTYVVEEGKRAAIIDPVLDFDAKSGRTGTASADKILEHVHECGLTVEWILETHAHADHLTAAPYLKQKTGAKIGIGEGISKVQAAFGEKLNLKADETSFDRLFRDGETFSIGALNVRVLATPGHTPACVTYLIGDAAFVGDTLFMPDFGTARADFPGGSAAQLYRSIQKILALPPETRIFMCHDYPPPARGKPVWESTVAIERKENLHVREGISEAEFVTMREARDKTLPVPALLWPAIQVNIRGGALPEPESDGRRYLKIPLDGL